MSLSLKGMLVAVISTGVWLVAYANAEEEAKGGLQSILVGSDDLRPLIDLDTTPVTPPRTKVTEQDNQVTGRFIPDADDEADAEPISVIPGLQPIPEFQPPQNSAPARSRATIQDPLFELGVSTVGQRVRGVFVDSPAHRAGLQPDDVITGIGGKAVKSNDQLANALRENLGLNSFPVIVNRGGQSVSIRVQTKTATIASAGTNQVVPRPRRRIPARPVSDQPGLAGQSNISGQPIITSNPVNARALWPAGAAAPNAPTTQAVRTPSVVGQPQPRGQRRPLIGQGGRLIGNGRIINSARRIIGR